MEFVNIFLSGSEVQQIQVSPAANHAWSTEAKDVLPDRDETKADGMELHGRLASSTKQWFPCESLPGHVPLR